MTSIRLMLECHRTAKLLQRFLDRDPAAPLSDADRLRVQTHLDQCEKCTAMSQEYAALHASLRALGDSLDPDPAAVLRVKAAVENALDAGGT